MCAPAGGAFRLLTADGLVFFQQHLRMHLHFLRGRSQSKSAFRPQDRFDFAVRIRPDLSSRGRTTKVSMLTYLGFCQE